MITTDPQATATEAVQGADAPAAQAPVATPTGEFAPVDLGTFLTPGTPDEGTTTDASTEAATAAELSLDASTLVPVVIAAPTDVPNALPRAAVTQTTLDPRQMPSIGTLLPEGAAATAEASREIRGLVPQFGDRLQRVIDRMQQEFGYTRLKSSRRCARRSVRMPSSPRDARNPAPW